MTETEEEIDLSLLFDWDQSCERPGALNHRRDEHPAELYIKFVCGVCTHVVVRAMCKEFWAALQGYMVMGGDAICHKCKTITRGTEGLERFSVVGEV